MDPNTQHDGISMGELQQMLDTRALEVEYEKKFQQCETILCDETTRRIHLQLLLLKSENNDLQAELVTEDERMEELVGYCKSVESQLKMAVDSLDSAQNDMRVKSREIEIMKAELSSLQGVTMDSTKLLTEKLTLARELSTLRPEVEHLRSQVASQHSLLTEKLSLQRQFTTCQVELETERRSTQRLLAKEGRLQAQDSLYEGRLEEIQGELAKERRERQKMERQAQKISTEWENQKITFESRLETLKNRLQSANDQLQEKQRKGQSAPPFTEVTKGSAAVGGVRENAGRNPRKRNITQVDPDKVIGTPGTLSASKKSKRASTLPGDKSTFSITPFLNRTVSLAPDSLVNEQSHSGEEEGSGTVTDLLDVLQNPNGASSATEPCKAQAVVGCSEDGRKRNLGLKGRTKPGKTSIGIPPTRKKPLNAPPLERVTEEGHDEESETLTIAQPKVTDHEHMDDTVSDDIDAKKRKRKRLGGGPVRTLFDEEEGEVPKGGRGLLVGARKFGAPGRVTFGGPKFGERARLGLAHDALSTFSPLKRDRRGA